MSKTIAVIYWKDSCKYGRNSYTGKDCTSFEPIKLISAGILINETEEFITIGNDYHDEEDSYRDVNVYPKSGIQKIRKIKIKS